MLSGEYWDSEAGQIPELYAQLHETIARDIARRLVKTGTLTQTARGQAERLRESGLLFDEVITAVTQHAGRSERQVRDLFLAAGVEAAAQDARIYKAAGLSAPSLHLSPGAMQVLRAGASKTNGQLGNLTKTTALEAQQAYLRACTLAEMQVESGAFDAVTAVRNAVREALKEGALVQYPSGHREKLDVAVRRAVLTGVNQTAAELGLHTAREMGCDLVETTAHSGARPAHAVWQGKVFSISGTHPRYPPFSQTGYGTGAGLCGWNCRHSFYPWFEGLSEHAYPRETLREYETRTVVYNGETMPYYEATQRQRAMERSIRATRRQLAGYDEAMRVGGKYGTAMRADFSNAATRLKQQEAKLRDFLRQTGLQNDSARVQVAGFGRSVSQRAVWADKSITVFESRQKFAQEIYIIPPNKGDAITHRSLYNDLMKSETGKKALGEVLSGKYDIEISYTDECEKSVLGRNMGKHIYIYAKNTNTIRRTSETLIHEITHASEKIGGDQWAEARCIAAEWLHRKTALTHRDLRDIIRLTKELYPHLHWRKGVNKGGTK